VISVRQGGGNALGYGPYWKNKYDDRYNWGKSLIQRGVLQREYALRFIK